ncbi:uncharacterized protein JCM15063_005729 [Sporobolomyces koalae]|uniref:uncharacterized protein n=1 Tax=Sporobolomyces koalae TaxID=500713 RepID=UPI00317DA393
MQHASDDRVNPHLESNELNSSTSTTRVDQVQSDDEPSGRVQQEQEQVGRETELGQVEIAPLDDQTRTSNELPRDGSNENSPESRDDDEQDKVVPNNEAGNVGSDDNNAGIRPSTILEPEPTRTNLDAKSQGNGTAESVNLDDSSAPNPELTLAEPTSSTAPIDSPAKPVDSTDDLDKDAATPEPTSVNVVKSDLPATQPSRAASVSPHPPFAAAATKRFSSSLSVNKKFLEKAGEKAHKPEPKPTTARSATPPVATPASTSHPRLMTGKISTSSPVQLSTKSKPGQTGSAANSSSGASGSINWSKPSAGQNGAAGSGTSTTAGNANNAASGPNAAGGRGAGAVWSNSAASGPGVTTKAGHYGGIGLGRGGGPRFNLAGDFPTAAEAAHAKEARAKAVLEQMQARERAIQARAAAAAAQNANLLQNLDAFRGVHLDPNAHHWDEDDDDFLDTTIEFADGTQYKITEEDAAAAQQQQQEEANGQAEIEKSARESDSLREPSRADLARLETPLKPGEVEETIVKSREERFGDDFDRSWPPKRSQPTSQQAPPPARQAQSSAAQLNKEKEDPAAGGRNLFNDRLGKLEPAQHGQAASGGRRRLSSGADRTAQDVPPHLVDRRGEAPSARRPSFSAKAHEPVAPPPVRNAWPRRLSNDLPTPSQGRQLPPHLAAAAAAAATNPSAPKPTAAVPPANRPAPAAAPSASSAPPTTASKVLSPPQPLAPLPEAEVEAAPAPGPAAQEDPAPEADLEELHAREMHAAAERAKKRRQEEEQARLEQIERAKKKAAELEEKMRLRDEEAASKVKASQPEQKVLEKVKEKSENPWRSTAKPPTSTGTVRPAAPSVPGPSEATKSSGSSVPSQQPTSILARPPQQKRPGPAPAEQPPAGPAAWRRSSNPLPPQTAPRSQQRQLPPHLTSQQQQQASTASDPSSNSSKEVAGVPPASVEAPSAADAASAASVANPSSVAAIEKPPTPPPVASPPTLPSSPSRERRASSKSGALGYKVPEVKQLDDLMSKIKGAMTGKEGTEKTDQTEADLEESQVPTVKLPPPTPITRQPRSRANDQAAGAAPSGEPRGRGRGRSDGPKNAQRGNVVPTFENREPVLPFFGSRRARSPSPPPAWKVYTVKLPARPPHKAPHDRNVKLFESVHNPRTVKVFSSNPLITGINPRRLSRDDVLIPKKFVKGKLQYSISIPSKRITRRTAEEELAIVAARPTPTVSIGSRTGLARSTEVDTASQRNQDAESPISSSPAPGGRRARDRTSESELWRRSRDAALDIKVPASIAQPDEQSLNRSTSSKSKLPLGSSIGFYRSPGGPPLNEVQVGAIDRSDPAKMFMVTSELNGEKVAAVPREETTAPGADLARQSMIAPSSPPFKPKDVAGVLASPSAAWTNKSLALSVLDPTASSVWSAAPVDSTVHARTISVNQPENSLQGIVDDDPSEALPSSLAELKSEDGHSNEGKETSPTRQPLRSKDDAKLRAVAPSFSSFLHDSAAAIDPSASESLVHPISSYQQPRPQPVGYTGFASSPLIPPQSTPSPVNAYSPAMAAFNPQMYPPQYTRAYPSSYGLSTAAGISPYGSQAPPGHPHYAPASPTVAPLKYPPTTSAPSPSLYARSAPVPTQSIPHGITNPALIANYNGGYGQNAMSSARYGAVGAGTRATAASSYGGGQPHQHRASYSQSTAPAYLSQPASYPHLPTYPPAGTSSNSPYTQPHAYRRDAASGHEYGAPVAPTPSTGSRPYTGGNSSTTTMPSPVIVPQHLPLPPPFYPQAAPSGSGAYGSNGGRFATNHAVGGW